jgi:GNAT superfamily N-acetyltransferase
VTARHVTLRKMTPAEYEAAADQREAESIRVLGRLMPEDAAREAVRRGTAILAVVEELVAHEGMTALGLNVVGDNEAAIALYRRCGYAVSSMSLRKAIG